MNVLVVNCGSSSVKAEVLEPKEGERLGSVRVERIGTPDATVVVDGANTPLQGQSHKAALEAVHRILGEHPFSVVAHRVVHGGERFVRPTLIDDAVVDEIEALIPLAPLHNPANLEGIRFFREQLPDLQQVAVFDTAFHSTIPRRAQHYAIDREVAQTHGIRRFGFHGPSHQWVSQQAANAVGEGVSDLRIITLHLGNGASACAVEFGRSVETTMGMTPLEGLVMGSRSGSVDPGVLLHLLREGMDLEDLDTLLNRRSGLKGLCGDSDLRDIEERAAQGDDPARLALHVMTHRIRKAIGGLAAVMGGVDVIVFTGGIGENSALVRHRSCQRLGFLGARFDEDKNRDAHVDKTSPIAELSGENSRVRIFAVATDEERCIGQSAVMVVEQSGERSGGGIPIAISARHIHLTEAAVETLFGAGHTLTPRNPLSQPGQYACEETLTVVGPRRSIEGVRVLGPPRSKCQVEVSRTDEFHLGIDAPVRRSGDVDHTPGITLQGPAGRLTLEQGVICAQRHIHMTPADAERMGVKHRDIVEVAVDSSGRDIVFGDVVVRVSDKFVTEMHVDTDEANAAELVSGTPGMLVGTGATARVRRRSRRYMGSQQTNDWSVGNEHG